MRCKYINEFFVFICNFLHDYQIFIFMIYSICTGFTFFFSVVISNSFNFIFETVLLYDSVNYSFLKIMLSASPALYQAHPIISVITQINAQLRLTV